MNCCNGVRGGDGVDRIAKLDNAAKVEDVEIVRCRSWLFLLSCWLADGKTVIERAEDVDVRLSCLRASEVVGDGWEKTGEADGVFRLNTGETARRLVGEDVVDICGATVSSKTVVKGARGAGLEGARAR